MGRADYRRGYCSAGGRVKPRTSTYQITTYQLHERQDERLRRGTGSEDPKGPRPLETLPVMLPSVVFRLAFAGIWV